MHNITSAFIGRDGAQFSPQSNLCHRHSEISEGQQSCTYSDYEHSTKVTSNLTRVYSMSSRTSRSNFFKKLIHGGCFLLNPFSYRMVPEMFCVRQLVFLFLSVNVLLLLNVKQAVADVSLPYPDKLFVKTFLSEFGNSETLTVDQLKDLLITLKKEGLCTGHDFTDNGHVPAVANSEAIVSDQSCNHSIPYTCLKEKCMNASGLVDLYSIPIDRGITATDLQRLSPALLYQIHRCQNLENFAATEDSRKKRPSGISTWGYGFLFVSIINVCSLGGAIVLPFMKSSFYKHILMFMLGLAVGSLAGSGLLFLIPEAFHLTTGHGYPDYIWKATTIMGGIYLFFLIEKFLKFLMEYKKRRRLRKSDLSKSRQLDIVATDPDYGICSVQMRTPSSVAENAKMKDLDKSIHVEGPGVCSSGDSPSISRENSTLSDDLPANGYSINGKPGEKTGGCVEKCKPENAEETHKTEIATVAWMIIFGDGLHNFIDGLSIGAAFTESILAGVSVSIAVICEELPHELGDFAILLNSGMSLKKALLYNFLSACMCYLGLIGGILLGQNTFAHDWIFALAGGMFLYISLVDMLPEMNSAAKEEERRTNTSCSWHVFMLQNSGLLIGYGLLLLMAIYGNQINFD